MDITQLILDDHHEQRRLFAILEQIDPADTGILGDLWMRLSAFLEVHAAAEEETLDAIHDHNDIRDAIAAVAGHEPGSNEWYEAVAAVNLANGDHMAEEEREGLTDFRREASLQLRHDLAVAFTAFEARHFAGIQPVDKDPAAYVRQAERSGRPPSGSLGIGSLKGRS